MHPIFLLVLSIVVQEKNKTPYQSGTYTDCSAVVAEMGDFEMSEDQVKVEETESGSLLVTNLTDEEIPCVRIFYKFYMADEENLCGRDYIYCKADWPFCRRVSDGDANHIMPRETVVL